MELRKVRRQTTGSYILTIPSEYVGAIGCMAGDWVRIELRGKEIVITKLEIKEDFSNISYDKEKGEFNVRDET